MTIHIYILLFILPLALFFLCLFQQRQRGRSLSLPIRGRLGGGCWLGRGFLLFLFCLPLQLAAQRQERAFTDTIATAAHHDTWAATLWGKSDNPALMAERFPMSYSEIFADCTHSDANEPLLYETGDGETFARIKADSYLRLSPRSTVWGEASYRTGKRRHVKWNSTADFLLLAPYVMGDSLGGNLSSERYTFAGGWAGSVAKSLTVGVEMTFRAEHEYRTYDPRPRSIVTDLSLTAGAAYKAVGYSWGLNAGARFYKQTNSVEFYREEGVIPEYQFVGLGMDYKRFSGSNTSAYYKATGFTAGFDARPLSASGLFASAHYDFTPFRRILPNLNALPLSTLYLQTANVEAGWRKSGKRLAWNVLAGIDYERRTGDEHIAGNSSGSEYRIVEILTMYHAHLSDLHASATLHYIKGENTFTAEMRGGMLDYAARYESPARSMDWRKAYGRVGVQWQRLFPKGRLFACHAEAAVYANIDNSIQMPYAAMDEANTQLVNYTYDHATANYWRAAAGARYDFPLHLKGRYGLFALANGGWTGNADYHAYDLQVAVGMTF